MPIDFSISTGLASPIYRQIVDQVLRGVGDGRLEIGERLPSVRGLAERLVINPNTVAKAYTELARDGIIESRTGRGYFVALRRRIYSKAELDRRIDQAFDALFSEASLLQLTPRRIREILDRRLSEIEGERDPDQGDKDG
jgi:GntR family transcriptional regulator